MDIEFHQLELRYAGLRIADADRRRRLAASVAEHGQQMPVVVVTAGERYVLIDGHARVAVLRGLKRDAVSAVVWPVTETEALIQCHHLQGAGSRSIVEEAWLLSHLTKVQGLSEDALAQRFCRSKSWVSRRLALVSEIPVAIAERVGQGAIAPQAAMKYLVPLARANRKHCETLIAAIGSERLSVRAIGRLYAGYRRADRTGRERIVKEPLLFLKAEREAAELEETSQDGLMALIKDLEILAGIARRAERHIQKGALLERIYAAHSLSGTWHSAEAAFLALKDSLKELADAGPEHADGHPPAW